MIINLESEFILVEPYRGDIKELLLVMMVGSEYSILSKDCWEIIQKMHGFNELFDPVEDTNNVLHLSDLIGNSIHLDVRHVANLVGKKVYLDCWNVVPENHICVKYRTVDEKTESQRIHTERRTRTAN